MSAELIYRTYAYLYLLLHIISLQSDNEELNMFLRYFTGVSHRTPAPLRYKGRLRVPINLLSKCRLS